MIDKYKIQLKRELRQKTMILYALAVVTVVSLITTVCSIGICNQIKAEANEYRMAAEHYKEEAHRAYAELREVKGE